MGVFELITGIFNPGGVYSNEEAVVETDRGKVRGKKSNHKVYMFRGIPYAAPPVGDLRFKKPQPREPWEGIWDCTVFGNRAVQAVDLVVLGFFPKFVQVIVGSFIWMTGGDPRLNTDPQKPHALAKGCSEDCLYLNVETPSLDGKLPVMVFIHGGAYMLGSSCQFIYHPHDSPLARKGVVLVTVNYRLGCFGFLKASNGDYNAAVWDQIEALKWVQRNIHKFGGDPSNVTIFGESAGAMSCAVLSAVSPTALPEGPIQGRLFHRVSMQSGCMQVGLTKQEAASVSKEAAEALGIEGDLTVEALAAFSPAQLLAVQTKIGRQRRVGSMMFQPVIDGELLPAPIVDQWRKGVAQSLRVILGYCRDEELMFLKLFPKLYRCEDETQLLQKVTRLLGPEQLCVEGYEESARRVVDEVKDWDTAHTSGPAEPESAESFWTSKTVLVGTALKFAIPCHLSAEILAKHSSGVYLFRVDVHSPIMEGAGHALDLPYVFGAHQLWGRMVPVTDPQSNADLSEAVTSAWTAFAATGDPNATYTYTHTPAPEGNTPAHAPNTHAHAQPASTARLPFWPQATVEDPNKVMVLDVPYKKTRVQHVQLHSTFPEMWRIVSNNNKAIWFSRPSPGNVAELAKTDVAEIAEVASASRL